MSEETCIFCKIVAGEIPATKIHEDEHAIAFHDITPKAPVHILIIPREHLESLNDAGKGDVAVLGHLLWLAPRLANQLGIAEDGFRTCINTGSDGGQSVSHLHIHVMGGRQMTWPPG